METLTIADQLNSGGLRWRAYMEDMAGETGPANCVHPGTDEAETPAPGGYTVAHNPFAYFHSLLDLGGCATNDVPLDELTKDLSKADATPNFAFISPNLCHAGVPSQCPDAADAEVPADPSLAAAAEADGFLSEWVPKILDSAAYKKDGLLIVTFGEAHPPADAADPLQVGALLVSRYAAAGQTIGTPYDPSSMLRSVEELFGIPIYLGEAGAKGTESFAPQLLGGGG